jgi:hypothetical protein
MNDELRNDQTDRGENAPAGDAAPLLPATRDNSGDDAPPPPVSTQRGPMDQTVPDVATGSTPLTRRDD